MSFVKKAIKKVWKFVKKNWKMIVLAAAIVFTAGVATVGFAAFSGVTGFGSFMGAVGQTMWAGVAGTAGSMGIGSGATVPTTAATVAAGTAGTQVGLGAAWGAGGGFGYGAAGADAAAAASANVVPAAEMVGYTGISGTAAPMTQAEAAAHAATAVESAGVGAGSQGAALAEKAVTEKGLSDTMWKALPTAVAGAGAYMSAKGEEDEYRKTDLYASTPDEGPRAGINMLAPPTDSFDPGGTGAAPQAEGASDTYADDRFQAQMNRSREAIMQPLMGTSLNSRGLDGRLVTAEEEYSPSLMG